MSSESTPAEPAEFLDFLYRDESRITSYYAQLLGGQVLQREEAQAGRVADESSGGITAVVKGEHKHTRENSFANRLLLNPHDASSVRLIRHLARVGMVYGDYAAAGNGRLVRAIGNLIFFESHFIRSIMSSFVKNLPNEMKRLQHAKVAASVFPQLAIPSGFILEVPGGRPVTGTIKEDGMEEPISTYLFKHAGNAVPDVEVLGIKEVGVEAGGVKTDGIKGTDMMSAAMRKLFLPDDAVVLTPLAIFRRVKPIPSN